MSTATLTPKGAATRSRIVEAAADLFLVRGVGGTSLDDIRAGTGTSKSQLFHYFPDGKDELVAAVVALQSSRVLDAQRPHLDHLDTWDSWESWRESVIAYYGSQAHWGCPLGTLASELLGVSPEDGGELTAAMERWRSCLEAGLVRMRVAGLIRVDADPARLALATFAALQGGLMLTRTMQSIEPLEAALSSAISALWAAAP